MVFMSRRRHFCTVALDRNEQSKLLYGAADKLSILPKAVDSGSGELALVHPRVNKLLAIRSLLSFLFA
jgi:hypothetical protein